ncbi:MAG TPA: SCP2 sterol-binding domain-containing protein [Candidatus Lokiarchaeia archaeon]|nr:SCP2 sterol-binding domain-containing protein [Candidatus Lokiarchaeia archaeon]
MVKFEDLKDIATNWAEEFSNAINASTHYARSAKKWGVDFDGCMLFVFQASGEIEEDFSIFLDLQAGKCLSIQVLAPGEESPRPAPMIVSAPMSTWKRVIFKEIDPVAALMQKQLDLVGDMSLVMRYAQAAVDLVNATEQTDRSLFTNYDLG